VKFYGVQVGAAASAAQNVLILRRG